MQKWLAFVLILVLLASVPLTACGGGGGSDELSGDKDTSKETPTVEQTTKTGDTKIDDPELIELLNPPEYEPPAPSSFDLIETALKEENISEDQAMGLRLMAGYTPELLPEQYQSSENTGRSSLQKAKVWLVKNWDTLDSSSQDELRPYYVSPDDPASYLNQENGLIGSAPQEGVYIQCNNPTTWSSIIATISESPVRKAKIFFKPGYEQQAQWAKNGFTKAYPMHENLLGVQPDPMIYIYIQPMSDYGSGYWDTKDSEYRGVIELKQGMNQKMTESTTAHELFHVFQFDMDLDYEPADEQWMMEATATWSEHYVYPDYNSEHEYLTGFFYYLNQTMIHYGNNREYSTYMWYLFLTQFTNNPSMVKKALTDAKTMTAWDAAQNIDFFDDTFAEYAVWNWNQEPTKIYQDVPDIPGNPKLGGMGAAYSSYEYNTKDEFPEVIYLPRLSMYYHACVFGNDIKKVVFKFDEAGDEEWQRLALVKIGDVWHREDWTYITERKFCRERDYEKVTAVVMIFTNSNDSTPHDVQFKVDTRGECTPGWHGTTNITWFAERTMQTGATSAKYSKMTGSCTTYDELKQDYDGNMTIMNRFIAYYSYDFERNDFDVPCGDIWNSDETVELGSYFFDYSNNSYQPEIWELEEDWDTEITMGITFYPPNYQSHNIPDWYTRRWTQAGLARGCVWRDDQFNYMCITDRSNWIDMFDEFYIEEIPDEDHPLQGTHTVIIEDYYLYGNLTINISYSYQYG